MSKLEVGEADELRLAGGNGQVGGGREKWIKVPTLGQTNAMWGGAKIAPNVCKAAVHEKKGSQVLKREQKLRKETEGTEVAPP